MEARQAGALALYAKGLLLESGESPDTNAAKKAALDAFRQACRLDPDNRRTVAAVASNLADAERFAEAQAALEAYLARHPQDRELRTDAARMADAAEHPADAARHCVELLKEEPDNRELAQALIRLYFQSGQAESALRVMQGQQARFHDAQSAALPVQWALHFTREGKQADEALACIAQALAQRTNRIDRAALMTLASENQLLLGQTNAAMATLQNAYREAPSLNTAILRLGSIWATTPDATNRLARQAQQESAPYATLLVLAATRQALDDAAGAAATLKDAFAQRLRAGYFPEEPVYLWLGALLEETRAHEELYRFLDDMLAVHPSSHEVKNFSAYMWAEKGVRLDQADRLINEALAVVPDNPAYLDTKGWVLYKKGRFFDALQFLLKAAERDKSEPVILDHVGDCLQAVGRGSEAISFWTRSHQLDPLPSVAEKLRKHGVAKPALP